MHSSRENMIEMRGITKRFSRVLANDNVDFSVKKGEIRALLGENGAGKSTLMNVLYGLIEKDAGQIFWKGVEVTVNSPSEALNIGIGMIHQHFQLVEKFTVLDNIILGLKEGKWIEINRSEAERRILSLAETYGLQIKPKAFVEDLTVGEQQRVEIIKALYRNSELLIMDEPTAVLTPQEVEKLFKILRKLREEGKSIVFISHKLPEVLELCDSISIMRDGKMIDTIPNTPDLSPKKLASLMVDREMSLEITKSEFCPGETVLCLENVFADPVMGSSGIKDISMEVRRGEIFGLAGVDGNGQTDLSELIMGLRKLRAGKIKFLGTDISNASTKTIRKLPIGYIPPDRLHAALVMDFSLEMNMAYNHPDQQPYGKWYALDFKQIRQLAKAGINKFNISTPGADEIAGNLSGGNQQKVVLAREVGGNVDLIIAVYPTRGLDIDATNFVFDVLLKARDAGAAVLYISTELEEIMALSDTIGVLYSGKLMGQISSEGATVSQIGLLMAGEQL